MKVQHLQSSCLDRAALHVEGLRFLENGPYSFSLLPTQNIGFSGQSGIGKSQLFRAIVDVLPFDGTVSYGEHECLKTTAIVWRKTIGLVPSEPVWWHDQIGEHFGETSIVGFDLDMVLERLGFSTDVLMWRVSRLSSGEKQRLAIVRALINNPGVLLLDEPTANLDEQVTLNVERLLKEYQQKTQIAYAIISHDSDQLCRFCETIYSVEKDSLHLLRDRPCKDEGTV